MLVAQRRYYVNNKMAVASDAALQIQSVVYVGGVPQYVALPPDFTDDLAVTAAYCSDGTTAILHTHTHTHTHTRTHPFNDPFSRSTRVSWYQKGKTSLDFTEARDSEWQWHQLGRMQVCISLQTDNHASTPPLKFFTGRMPFLPPNQQCQSTECTSTIQLY